MKSVNDAIESFFAYLKHLKMTPFASNFLEPTDLEDVYVEMLERAQNSSMFFMGLDEDLSKSINTVTDDLIKDFEYGFPMPFNEMAMLVRYLDDSWCAVILLRVSKDRLPTFNGCENLIFVASFVYRNFWFTGKLSAFVDVLKFKDKSFQLHVIARGGLDTIPDEDVSALIGIAFKSMALISHPNNYILLETPKLSLKEERRVEEGKHISGGKRPRYIIVDHEVLVGMRTPSNGHASPIPHKRRGHWMRLAERCIHAKSRGNDRAWVKHCDVGQLEFESEGSRYQVLTDFQDRIRREGLSDAR